MHGGMMFSRTICA